MSRIAITGAASGIGATTRKRLEAAGHEVLGIDLRGDDVDADLSTPTGRDAAASAIADWCGGTLDGFVPCAGLGPPSDPQLLTSVNYFGAVRLTESVRPLLAAADQPAVVVIASNSATTVPGLPADLVDACLTGDEDRARSLARDSILAYGASKLALSRWMRRNAPAPEWAGNGIRLNAVAPGAVQTPLLQSTLDDPVLGELVSAFPIPTGERGQPDDIAAVIEFLLSPAARYVCGAVWFVDGGTDALMRPDAF